MEFVTLRERKKHVPEHRYLMAGKREYAFNAATLDQVVDVATGHKVGKVRQTRPGSYAIEFDEVPGTSIAVEETSGKAYLSRFNHDTGALDRKEFGFLMEWRPEHMTAEARARYGLLPRGVSL